MDGDDLGRGSSPGGGAGVGIGKEGVVHGVDEDLHVGGGHIVRIRLEL